MVIAIDGPAGSGKSTVAKGIAQALEIVYFDSGAVYRLMTLIVQRELHDVSTEKDYLELFKKKLPGIELNFTNKDRKIFYFGEDVSSLLRSEQVTRDINKIANHGPYREMANGLIRKFASNNDIVIDGRDIGTVVFPDTPFKFYLDASPELRAMRRYQELQNNLDYGEKNICLAQITKDMRHRDSQDQNRAVAPLQRAQDAVYIQSDDMSIEQVIQVFLDHIFRIREIK